MSAGTSGRAPEAPPRSLDPKIDAVAIVVATNTYTLAHSGRQIELVRRVVVQSYEKTMYDRRVECERVQQCRRADLDATIVHRLLVALHDDAAHEFDLSSRMRERVRVRGDYDRHCVYLRIE